MALRLSTGLRNSILADAFNIGATMAYVDGGGGNDYITDSENSFLTRGFRVGKNFTTAGSTTGANDLTNEPILAVAAGKLEFATGQVNTPEAFAAGTTITSDNGESFQELMKDGVIRIYSGSQPASADSAETGTLLLTITLNSGAFTPGSPTNGLEFGPVISGVVSKLASEVWSGLGVANGTAGWFRFYSNEMDTGADSTAVRFDGSVGTSGANLNMSSTSVVENATTTVDSFSITLPAS